MHWGTKQNQPPGRLGSAREFFSMATRNVLAAEAPAGVKHHVILSIVGCDRVDGDSYLDSKFALEEEVRQGSVPMVDLVRRVLQRRDDSRQVVTDRSATYFGVAVEQDSLVPLSAVTLASTTLTEWLRSESDQPS